MMLASMVSAIHVDVGEGHRLPSHEAKMSWPCHVMSPQDQQSQPEAEPLYFSSESLNYSRNFFGPLTYGLPRS
jgi:hypothetical protein